MFSPKSSAQSIKPISPRHHPAAGRSFPLQFFIMEEPRAGMHSIAFLALLSKVPWPGSYGLHLCRLEPGSALLRRIVQSTERKSHFWDCHIHPHVLLRPAEGTKPGSRHFCKGEVQNVMGENRDLSARIPCITFSHRRINPI